MDINKNRAHKPNRYVLFWFVPVGVLCGGR